MPLNTRSQRSLLNFLVLLSVWSTRWECTIGLSFSMTLGRYLRCRFAEIFPRALTTGTSTSQLFSLASMSNNRSKPPSPMNFLAMRKISSDWNFDRGR